MTGATSCKAIQRVQSHDMDYRHIISWCNVAEVGKKTIDTMYRMYRLITCTWGWRFEACAAGWKPGRASQQSFDSTYLAPSEGSFDGTRNSSWQTPFSHFPPHWWMHLVSKHSQSTVAKATSKFQSHKVPHLLRLFISIHANQLSRAKCFKPHRLRIWTIRVWWLCWFSVPYLCVLEFSVVLLYFDKVPFPLQCGFSSFFSQVPSSLWCWTCEWGLKQKRNLGSANNI